MKIRKKIRNYCWISFGAAAAMRAGANDYIMKSNTKRLLPAVERELREYELRKEGRRSQEQLRQSEERFRQLAENINEVFFLVNADGTSMIYISPAYEQVWGRSCQSIYDNPLSWLEAVYPEDRPCVLSLFSKSPNHFQAEYRIIRPDGGIRWIWARTFPIKNQEGTLYRLAGIAEDITERKQAEEEFRESEARFRQMAESITEVFWMTNPDKHDLLYVSPGYEKIWGRPCKDVYEHPTVWMEAIHPDDRERVIGSAMTH